MDEETQAQKILASYLDTISTTPTLLSLLYDADMLPEQTVTVRGAISVVAVVVAYKAALEDAARWFEENQNDFDRLEASTVADMIRGMAKGES